MFDDIDDGDAPEVRIAVTTLDGTVIDIIECTKDDLRNEVKRNPTGLLSEVNTNLL